MNNVDGLWFRDASNKNIPATVKLTKAIAAVSTKKSTETIQPKIAISQIKMRTVNIRTMHQINDEFAIHLLSNWWLFCSCVCVCVLHYVAALQFMSFILWNSALCASPYRDLACDSNCLSSTRMNLTGWQKKLIDAFMNAPGHQRNSLKSLCICWPDSYCGFNYCLIFLFSPSAIENL